MRNIRTVVEALDDASVARLAGLQDATAQLSVTAASEQEFEAGKAVLAERFPEFANEIANETFARADENIFESVALRAAIADKNTTRTARSQAAQAVSAQGAQPITVSAPRGAGFAQRRRPPPGTPGAPQPIPERSRDSVPRIESPDPTPSPDREQLDRDMERNNQKDFEKDRRENIIRACCDQCRRTEHPADVKKCCDRCRGIEHQIA